MDVFRRPNQLEESDFEAAWGASAPHFHNIRLLEETYLIATKLNSEQEKDQVDIHFLEGRLRQTLAPRVRACPLPEAAAAFQRYADHVTCLAAIENPNPGVRTLGLQVLRELANSNNPFAIEALTTLDLGET